MKQNNLSLIHICISIYTHSTEMRWYNVCYLFQNFKIYLCISIHGQSPAASPWFSFLCLSEIFHTVMKFSSWIIHLLDIGFWVTVLLVAPLWSNSFVLVYNWLPNHRVLLQSIFQSVMDFLASFCGFTRLLLFLPFLFTVLWNNVMKESYLSSHHNVFILSRTLI